MTTKRKFLCHFCFFSLSYICGSWLHYLQDSCSMIFQGERIRIWKVPGPGFWPNHHSCQIHQHEIDHTYWCEEAVQTVLLNESMWTYFKTSNWFIYQVWKKGVECAFFQDKNGKSSVINLYWKSIIYQKGLMCSCKLLFCYDMSH